MNHVTNKKLNNKGFSLVELIIVIAIMAVLIVVLAPQYLRYVERSRNSTDRSNADSIESALMVWGSETDVTLDLYPAPAAGATISGTVTITDAAFTVASANADMEDAINAALTNAGIAHTIRCQSRSAFTQYVVTVTVNDNGNVTVTTAES